VRDEWKFHTPVARLYRLIGKENAVRTPKGLGTLLIAHDYPGGCHVQLMNERETVKGYGKKKAPRRMRQFNHEEVTEA
jgi:hypothetical protein